jgi:hypothetical protein
MTAFQVQLSISQSHGRVRFCILEVLCSNLDPDIHYPDWDSLLFFAIPPGKLRSATDGEAAAQQGRKNEV